MNVFPSARISAASAFRRSVPVFVLACTALLAAPPVFPAGNDTAAPTRAEVSEKKTDLKELRGQIESLRKKMTAAEGQRADAVDQVKDVERDISATQRELHDLSGQKGRLQTTLKDLGRQEQALAGRLDELHAQLAQTGTGYLLGQARGQEFRNGFFDQTVQLWNEAGTMLATSHQIVYYKE